MTNQLEQLRQECSELKRQLHESEERYRILTETSLQGVSVIQDDRIVFCTPLFANSLGYSTEEILSFTAEQVAALVHPDDREIILKRRQCREAGKRVPPSFEYRAIKSDGSIIWVQVFTSMIEYNGRPAIQSAFIDITERKLAENALRERESHFRILFENAGLAILIMDEQGLFVKCNQKALEMYGCSENELIGAPPWRFSPLIQSDGRKSQESAQEKINAAFSSGVQLFEWTHQRLDSTLFEAEVALSAVRSETSTIVFCFVRDITERKRAEAALKESEQRFRLISETIDVYLWIYDFTKSSTVYLSPAFDRVCGFPREKIINKSGPLEDPIHPDDREKCLAGFARMHAGIPLDHEYRIIRPDGEVRHIWDCGSPVYDGNGKVIQCVGFGRDVTEWRQAEAALKESREYLLQILDCMGDPIYVRDREHKTVLANKIFCDVAGMSQEEVLGKTVRDFLPKHRADLCWQYEEKVFNTGEGGDVEEEIPDINGNPCYFLTKRKTFVDGKGNIQLITSVRDITEIKRLYAQFLQSQKMEALGVLAGGVAHDFNNLLNVIIGYSELIRDNLGDDSPIRTDLQQVLVAGRQAAALTAQLLAFGRRQIIQPEILNLNEIIEDMSLMLRRLIGTNIRIKIDAQPDLGLIQADPGQIHQIIMNLAINARDAMAQGGQLTFETHNVNVAWNYIRNHPVAAAGPYIMLAVSDTGVGMDEATKSRIFEPFFTTKEKGKGTGLGLSTIYGIVKQNNGYIWVYSELGKGTTFKIYFPRIEGQAGNKSKKTEESHELCGSETILVVEDEALVRALAVRILRDHGYQVMEAADGGSALRLAGEYQGKIHLVLTDTVMQGMGGKELVDRIKESRPDILSLFTSGYTAAVIEQNSILDKNISFLPKPYDVTVLLHKIREVLEANSN